MSLVGPISADHMILLSCCGELERKPAMPGSFGGWRGTFRESHLTKSWQEHVLSVPMPSMWGLAVTKGSIGIVIRGTDGKGEHSLSSF